MKARLFVSVSFLALWLMLTNCGAADWTQYRGPDGSGISSETGLNDNWTNKPPKELWRAPCDGSGFAAPTATGDSLFILDHKDNKGVLRRMLLETGKDVWRFVFNEEIGSKQYGYSRSAPTIVDGRIYFLSRNGEFFCVTLDKGAKVWSRDIFNENGGLMPEWLYTAAPAIESNRAYVVAGGSNSAAVVALSLSDGKTVWAGGGNEPVGHATPFLTTIYGERQVIAFTGTALVGVRAADGALRWRFPVETPSRENCIQPLMVAENRIFISSMEHGATLLEVTADWAVKQVYATKEFEFRFAAPILYKGFIYGENDKHEGRLICFDAVTGAIKWQQSGWKNGGIVGVDGKAIAVNAHTGDTVLFDMTPDGYKERGRIRPFDMMKGNEIYTAPIIFNGRLIMHNDKVIVCLDLR
jgi:outer membrane protein assembly factor BamB